MEHTTLLSKHCKNLTSLGRVRVNTETVDICYPQPDVNNMGFAYWSWTEISPWELDALLTYYGMDHPCIDTTHVKQFVGEFKHQAGLKTRHQSLSIDVYFAIYGTTQKNPIE